MDKYYLDFVAVAILDTITNSHIWGYSVESQFCIFVEQKLSLQSDNLNYCIIYYLLAAKTRAWQPGFTFPSLLEEWGG